MSSNETVVAQGHVEGLVPILLRYEVLNFLKILNSLLSQSPLWFDEELV